MFRNVRRQDREIDRDEAIEILKSKNYGVLSTVDTDGCPYGVPLNYVYCDEVIYFHSAMEGHKIDNIKNNSKVCFSVVGEETVIPQNFSTKYESVTVFGNAVEVSEEEKTKALLALINKYSPDYMEKGKEYIKNSSKITNVIKIEINHISGKAIK